MNIVRQYRDYVLNGKGTVPGWRVFPDGLAIAYHRTGDETYKEAVLLMAKNALYAPSYGGTPSPIRLREVTYLVDANVEAEKLGAPRDPRFPVIVDYALGMADMLYRVTADYDLHQSFLDGLLMEALIRYYEHTKDPRIPPTIQLITDWIWAKTWNSVTGKIAYTIDTPASPFCSTGCGAQYPEGHVMMTDLLNLIVPGFAWYYQFSHEPKYRDRAIEMFEHSLDTDISYSGKIFSQNYRWSFDLVKWLQ